MSGRTLAALVVASMVFGIASAWAGKPREWEVGVGGMAFLAGSFLDEPAEKDKTKRVGNQTFGVIYPGFAGFGAGGGISLHGMYKGFVGLEIDLFFAKDQGTGQVNGIDVTLSQTSLHLPILVKGAIPFKTVRPFIYVGPEIIFPGSADAEVDTRVANKIGANADTYTVLAYGLGMDICLPVKNVDLRIPIALRGNYNLATPTNAGDRLDVFKPSDGTMVFNSEWQYQAAATIGVVYYFL